jgi:hypothetical protein
VREAIDGARILKGSKSTHKIRRARMKSRPAHRQQIHWLPLLSIALLSAGMGCGDETTTAPQAGDAPAFVSTRGEGLNPMGDEVKGETITKTMLIPALKGGKVVAGRHSVTFPPGALLRDTEITVVDVTARDGYVKCELYPHGIVFLKGVTLETQISDLTSPSGYSMYWLANDSLVDVWMNVGGRPTSDGKGIAATLYHFSTYAPGKTGW